MIIGYTVYIDLIREEFPDKTFLSTPMRKEADRCRMAFEEAQKGRDVGQVGVQWRLRNLWYGRSDL